MGGEVILVAVDASKGISSDYVMEWTIQNVIKPEDLLILLVLLPAPNLHRRLQSLACYFLSCRKRHNKGSPFNQVDQSERDISRQTNYALYVHKMQQICLAYNLIQVHYKVKVILDAQLGAIASEAKELKASWMILDRLLKKEADDCIKQMNSNIVLIDHAIPRILKAVTPMAGENFSKNQIKPTKRDSNGATRYIMDDDKTETSTSTFSLHGTDKEYHCETNPWTVNDSHSFLYLNSENFSEDFKYRETFNPSSNEISSKNIDEAENTTDILRTKSCER